MAATAKPISYTDVEIRSYLPSGWGIVPGRTSQWNPEKRAWSVEVYDGAHHVWQVEVGADDAERAGRFPALKSAIGGLDRKALGRKSILTG